MNQIKKIVILLITSVAFVNVTYGQDFLEDLSLYPDSYITKKIHDNPDINQYYPFIDGRGNHPNLNSKKDFPKKVALVSFYVWNDELVISKKTVEEFWANTSWIDSLRGNKLASSLNSYSIESIIHQFDSLGTELITPSNFSVEQKNTYDTFQVNYSKPYRKNVPEGIKYDLCSSSSYRFIKISKDKLDSDFANSFKDLAQLLNVDAVLLIENKISFDGKLGLINTITMNLYGFNPMGVEELVNTRKSNKKITYNDFLLYTSIELKVDAVISQYNEQVELTYENYIGYDRLLDLMIDRMFDAYKKRTEILPKKI